MTQSQIMLAAHAEARKMRGVSYVEAMKFGLRRVYNKLMTDRFVAWKLAQPKTPKFMWLRGM